MKKRFLSVLLGMVLLISVMGGCGTGKGGAAVNDTVNSKTVSSSPINKNEAVNETTDAKDKINTVVKKKIVIVQEGEDVGFAGTEREKMVETLDKSGYADGKSAEITIFKMAGDEKLSPAEIVKRIKEMRPDAVLVASGATSTETIVKPLSGTDIPVIMSGANVEPFVDSKGKPKQNITGLYAMANGLELNAYSLLQKVAPINGKKAVFVTVDGYFNKDVVKDSLEKLNIELKDFAVVKYKEDFEETVERYNNDNEVGWILLGVGPSGYKDGTTGKQIELFNWFVENSKKPGVTYWDISVNLGIICGLAVDIDQCGIQAGEMTAKILNGENVENVLAQYPSKTLIELNQKTADKLGIKFSAEILGATGKIYKDYEGHYVGQYNK